LNRMLQLSGLERVTLKKEPKFFRKVENPIQIPDSTKIRNLTGWHPEITIDKTLSDLLVSCGGEINGR
jgi:nucleoside-diphosphate-sugar epimerase